MIILLIPHLVTQKPVNLLMPLDMPHLEYVIMNLEQEDGTDLDP
jgi:hypothetical protein